MTSYSKVDILIFVACFLIPFCGKSLKLKLRNRPETYLIFVTTITTAGCGEKICHVEKFLHMTDCHVQKISTRQIVSCRNVSIW